MSLPKRDGVHNRYYLIHKPDTSPEVLAEADLCIQDVLNGTARENRLRLPDRSAKSQRDTVSPRSTAGAVSDRSAVERNFPVMMLFLYAMPCGGWLAGKRSAISWRST